MKIKFCLCLLVSLSSVVSSTFCQSEDDADVDNVGPDTCGQDRTILGDWFVSHGSPDLIVPPLPPLTTNVTANPYDDPSNPPVDPEASDDVCAIKWEEVETEAAEAGALRRYRMSNFSSEAAAGAAGFVVTHKGHCGACSSLQDLGTYMRRNLTAPTRACGALGWFSTRAELSCLSALGFSAECATIWAWNILNTRSKCLEKCLYAWWSGEPNNRPDGSLNDCLQCDEDRSGPNFKYFSGRTRRNSGIPSAIHRPPWQVYNMSHCYWYGDL